MHELCRTDARSKSRMKVTFILPCKKEEDEVNVNKLDEVKVVVNLINQRNIQVTGKFVAAYMLYAAYESGILDPPSPIRPITNQP